MGDLSLLPYLFIHHLFTFSTDSSIFIADILIFVRGHLWHLVVETRDAGSIMHMTDSHNRSYLFPNINSTKVKKPCSRDFDVLLC